MPRIRRYAAAYAGSTTDGDQWIEAALLSLIQHEGALLQHEGALPHDGAPTRLSDYLHVLHRTPRVDQPRVDHMSVDAQNGVAGKLSCLDNDTRAVLLLRGLEDLATTDIAEIIGRREQDVEVMHRRGLSLLRDRGAAQADDKAA